MSQSRNKQTRPNQSERRCRPFSQSRKNPKPILIGLREFFPRFFEGNKFFLQVLQVLTVYCCRIVYMHYCYDFSCGTVSYAAQGSSKLNSCLGLRKEI